ncbi:UDP-N-acetylmuramyl-tripeptide synthetase [Candidatus Kaiserbacteria bacterium]|nr:UDP-N-acetylmuramyl-tripeptide synthetase [Candidatus Kaiserbacteria bacterium]
MYEFVDRAVRILKKIVPEPVVRPLRPLYHRMLAFLMALWYGFPARKLTIIGVTGTKGKSTVTDLIYATLLDNGYAVAAASTIRFAIKDRSEPNLFKMTMPGRGFIQDFFARAVRAGCTHAVVEITSESTRDFRHLFLDLDALVFTNLQKEHLESHGSFEKYAEAKMKIGGQLAASAKRPRAIIANADDSASAPYLALPVEKKIPFSYADAKKVVLSPGRVAFAFRGVRFSLQLPGSFNVMNALAAALAAQCAGLPLEKSAAALAKLERVPGRTERIDTGQNFQVVVDYAHTPDSLAALYAAYPGRKICVLGNTGGGRDAWKRPEMGRIADETCETVILTNEDPYDEDLRAIVLAMAAGMKRAPLIIMDRREAIRAALAAARPGDAVLISGKGTDPFIMGAKGSKIPWSDAAVVREELERLLEKF